MSIKKNRIQLKQLRDTQDPGPLSFYEMNLDAIPKHLK